MGFFATVSPKRMRLPPIPFTEAEQAELNHERYHHEHPRVRQRMEVLWLKSQGLSNPEVQQLAGVGLATVTRYMTLYREGGIERLKQRDVYRPESQLEPYREVLKKHFEAHPVASVNQAIEDIKQVTGVELKREAVRVFLHSLGLRLRKVGMIPAKADPAAQDTFKKKS